MLVGVFAEVDFKPDVSFVGLDELTEGERLFGLLGFGAELKTDQGAEISRGVLQVRFDDGVTFRTEETVFVTEHDARRGLTLGRLIEHDVDALGNVSDDCVGSANINSNNLGTFKIILKKKKSSFKKYNFGHF